MSSPNLDFHCFECAAPLADIEVGLINKAVGVLQENGVYALILFLKSRGDKEKEPAQRICEALCDLWGRRRLALHDMPAGSPYRAALAAAGAFAQDVDQLLFARDVTERMLIYARYHAKAGLA